MTAGAPSDESSEATPDGAALAPWEAALESALDRAQREAAATAAGGGSVVVPLGAVGDLVLHGATVDGVGVRADTLRWRPAATPRAPLGQRADAVARHLAAPLGGPLAPIEVDARLNRATLRTPLPALRRGRFWHVELEFDGAVAIERYRVVAGERHREPLTLTREQLRDALEGLSEV